MRVRGWIGDFLDNYRVKMKLQFLYVVCVLLPLILTDSMIIFIVFQSAETTKQHNMENVASAVEYSFINRVENTARTAKKIYTNKYIDRFLEKKYTSALDYVTSYQDFVKDTLFETGFGDTALLTMYVDNPSIVNGGVFSRLDKIENNGWYTSLKDTSDNERFLFYYDDSQYAATNGKRKIIFVKKLDFFHDKKKVLKLEFDYSNMVQSIIKMNYEMPVYICAGDTILLSNRGHNGVAKEFDTFAQKKEVGYTKEIRLYGMDLNIYVLKPEETVWNEIRSNLPIVCSLILVNIILPLLMMKGINRSFTERLQELSEVFERVEDDNLVEIHTVRGKDEIGSLMRNYNKMVVRINQLIQIVYKNKLREQEMDIAKQNAELLALHSQINPHFLFNALESLRMHSILKNELETACMVEQLAIMERQNVEWGNDCVEIDKELEFVKAYLELQKYRFGERLSYEVEVEETCRQMRIPKLTVVTFVENACVHGIESKTSPGWIFVRVYLEKDNLCLEVEDTGNGMTEVFMEELRDKMEQASIDSLKTKERVGIINACLRLKMVTKGEVRFELDGEEGVGTMVQIRIPTVYV